MSRPLHPCSVEEWMSCQAKVRRYREGSALHQGSCRRHLWSDKVVYRRAWSLQQGGCIAGPGSARLRVTLEDGWLLHFRQQEAMTRFQKVQRACCYHYRQRVLRHQC